MASKSRSPKKKTPPEPWADAVAHLQSRGERWVALIEKVGPCQLDPKPNRFDTLVRSIIGQQISAKAAASIDQRLRDLAGETHLPESLIAIGEEGLRSVGLSGVKARYVLNLSNAVQAGETPLHEYHDWDDEAIIANLTQIKGIGSWTAEMFLIFCLNRPDVLSVGDLAIRAALKKHHDLNELPSPKLCRELTEDLRPYRSIAMWYFWKDISNPTKS